MPSCMKTVYEKVAGFNLHTFSDDMQQLTTDFIDYTGKVIHSFTTTKGQVKPPATHHHHHHHLFLSCSISFCTFHVNKYTVFDFTCCFICKSPFYLFFHTHGACVCVLFSVFSTTLE
jgi:hypothetical protein